MKSNIQIQREIVIDLDSQLTFEKVGLNLNSMIRDQLKESLFKNIKILKVFGLIFLYSLLAFYSLEKGTWLFNIAKIINFTSIYGLFMHLGDYIDSKRLFKKRNNDALESSKMVSILEKKLEEEEIKLDKLENNINISHANSLSNLNKVKEFLLLARKYSENSERYQALFDNDLEKKYFESESEESMIIQNFILDDIRAKKELEDELKDVKVLSKVKK